MTAQRFDAAARHEKAAHAIGAFKPNNFVKFLYSRSTVAGSIGSRKRSYWTRKSPDYFPHVFAGNLLD